MISAWALSRLLKKKLHERDMNPRAFAMFIGMNDDHLRKLYNGQLNPGTAAVRRICEGLDIDFEETMKLIVVDE